MPGGQAHEGGAGQARQVVVGVVEELGEDRGEPARRLPEGQELRERRGDTAPERELPGGGLRTGNCEGAAERARAWAAPGARPHGARTRRRLAGMAW